MLLCQVILGNLEAVEPGSHEFFFQPTKYMILVLTIAYTQSVM